MNAPSALPGSVDATLELLTRQGYLAERSLATVTFLSLRMGCRIYTTDAADDKAGV